MTKSPLALAAASLLIAGAALAAPAKSGVPAKTAARGGAEGTWSVQMQTESGLCARSYNYTVAVENGRVRYIPAPDDAPTRVTGTVAPDGGVTLAFERSVARADASGRLASSTGSGTWRLNMLGCSGRWTAQKRSVAADRG